MAGIDLGHERTRVVCLDTARGPGTVVGWADEPTPPGLFFSGRLRRVVEAGAWIRRVLAATGAPRPSSVVLAIAPADAQVRRVSVPTVEERTDVLRALRSHAQFRGTDALEWCFDYRVLDAGAGQVLAVAGTYDGIGLVQALARAASLPQPAVVSASEVGLLNAWRHSAGEEIASRRLLLEGGHGGVTLALVEDGMPLAFRRVLLAGGDLQRDPGGGDVTHGVAREWAARISSEMRILVGAVVRDGGATPAVSIAGGLASSRTLRDALQEARGAPVVPMDVFAAVDVLVEGPTPDEAAGLAVAFGLAAGGAVRPDPEPGAAAVHVNLNADGTVSSARVHDSPRAIGVALYRDPRVRGAAVAAILLALALVGADAGLARRVRAAEAELGRARRDSSTVAADLARVRALEAERARLGGDAATILALDRARDAWPRFMDRVATVLPRYVWLGGRQEMKDLDSRTGAFDFVLHGFAGSTEQVAVFERALQGGNVAEAVVTSTARVDLAGIAAIRWEMRGRVALPPDPLLLVPLEEDVGYRGSGEGTPAPTTTESGVH